MSYQDRDRVKSWLIDDGGGEGLGPIPRLVLIELAECANGQTGRAWPGQERLARLAGCSTRHIKRTLSELRRAGLIEPVGKPARRGHRAEYVLTGEVARVAPTDGEPGSRPIPGSETRGHGRPPVDGIGGHPGPDRGTPRSRKGDIHVPPISHHYAGKRNDDESASARSLVLAHSHALALKDTSAAPRGGKSPPSESELVEAVVRERGKTEPEAWAILTPALRVMAERGETVNSTGWALAVCDRHDAVRAQQEAKAEAKAAAARHKAEADPLAALAEALGVEVKVYGVERNVSWPLDPTAPIEFSAFPARDGRLGCQLKVAPPGEDRDRLVSRDDLLVRYLDHEPERDEDGYLVLTLGEALAVVEHKPEWLAAVAAHKRCADLGYQALGRREPKTLDEALAAVASKAKYFPDEWATARAAHETYVKFTASPTQPHHPERELP